MAPQVIILAAGLGTRLGRPLPKPLTRLANGRTILDSQVGCIREVFGPRTEILVVVGFKLEHILEAVPDVAFAYNEDYDRTNTSKSLLKGLELTGDRPVLWMNGDVVFDRAVLDRVARRLDEGGSFICVDTAAVGDEEVKYTRSPDGAIRELSKTVAEPLGEAVGINHVCAADKSDLIEALRGVDADDYFERGIEVSIERCGTRFEPLDISDLFAVEVDFEDDLLRANEHL